MGVFEKIVLDREVQKRVIAPRKVDVVFAGRVSDQFIPSISRQATKGSGEVDEWSPWRHVTGSSNSERKKRNDPGPTRCTGDFPGCFRCCSSVPFPPGARLAAPGCRPRRLQ